MHNTFMQSGSALFVELLIREAGLERGTREVGRFALMELLQPLLRRINIWENKEFF